MEINQYIDHTLLKPDATVDRIRQLCEEAAAHKFAAVCINPCYIEPAVDLLQGTGVKVATVIGFPLGAALTAVKVFEAGEAVLRKADELDMVINFGMAKLGCWQAVTDEIKQVVQAAQGRKVKVIVEAGCLTDEEKRRACQSVLAGGADFIKTSTGFGPGGATEADIKLFKSIVGGNIGIKASGGIRTRLQAEAMIAAGADRIGTSAGVAIMKGQ